MRWEDSDRLMPTLTRIGKSSKAATSALSNNEETRNEWKSAVATYTTETVLFWSYFDR